MASQKVKGHGHPDGSDRGLDCAQSLGGIKLNQHTISPDFHKGAEQSSGGAQVRFALWLDRPTCRDRQREIDGAMLAERFAGVPVDKWHAIGGAS